MIEESWEAKQARMRGHEAFLRAIGVRPGLLGDLLGNDVPEAVRVTVKYADGTTQEYKGDSVNGFKGGEVVVDTRRGPTRFGLYDPSIQTIDPAHFKKPQRKDYENLRPVGEKNPNPFFIRDDENSWKNWK